MKMSRGQRGRVGSRKRDTAGKGKGNKGEWGVGFISDRVLGETGNKTVIFCNREITKEVAATMEKVRGSSKKYGKKREGQGSRIILCTKTIVGVCGN